MMLPISNFWKSLKQSGATSPAQFLKGGDLRREPRYYGRDG
jgi:hypothetical protein